MDFQGSRQHKGLRQLGQQIPQDGMHLGQLISQLLHQKLEGVPPNLRKANSLILNPAPLSVSLWEVRSTRVHAAVRAVTPFLSQCKVSCPQRHLLTGKQGQA